MAPLHFPPTFDQNLQKCDEFIRSIDVDTVCKLASLHNDGKPCHAFQEPANGSYNVCYFVQFEDNVKWVVRIPLVPVICNVWAKIENEVATLQYLESNTGIPVPHVHAYGNATDTSNPTGLAYMILDCIPGKALDIRAFIESDKARKNELYTQLVDIYAELRQQEFDKAGSLMIDPDGGSAPVLGPLLSLQQNELEVELGGVAYPTDVFHSVADFTLHYFNMLERKYALPDTEMSLETLQMEVFAFYDLKKRIAEPMVPENENQRFVLAHPDLRWSNIMVDDDWEIQGIIDWEWTGTVPTQFFLPPTWISGRLPERANDVHYAAYYFSFRDVIYKKADTSKPCKLLAQTWGWSFASTIQFSLGLVLRHHNNFLPLYYQGIFPKFYDTSRHDEVKRFFDNDGEDGKYTAIVRQQLEISKQYDVYLAENGLLGKLSDDSEDKAKLAEDKVDTERPSG